MAASCMGRARDGARRKGPERVVVVAVRREMGVRVGERRRWIEKKHSSLRGRTCPTRTSGSAAMSLGGPVDAETVDEKQPMASRLVSRPWHSWVGFCLPMTSLQGRATFLLALQTSLVYQAISIQQHSNPPRPGIFTILSDSHFQPLILLPSLQRAQRA